MTASLARFGCSAVRPHRAGCILYGSLGNRPNSLPEAPTAGPRAAVCAAQVIAGVVPPIPRRYSMELRELITRMLEVRSAPAGPAPPTRPAADHGACRLLIYCKCISYSTSVSL